MEMNVGPFFREVFVRSFFACVQIASTPKEAEPDHNETASLRLRHGGAVYGELENGLFARKDPARAGSGSVIGVLDFPGVAGTYYDLSETVSGAPLVSALCNRCGGRSYDEIKGRW